MQHGIQKKNPALLLKRKILLIVGLVIMSICIFMASTLLIRPERSIANFCQAAKEEKDSFKSNTSYDKLLRSFEKIDQVAPEKIRHDTALIVKGYESIVNDPSETLSSELGITNSQMRVSDYITANCSDF